MALGNETDIKIIEAARIGNMEILRDLIGRHDPGSQDVMGNTVFMAAAENGHAEAFQFLLDTHGADDLRLSVRNQNGDTALTLAAQNGHVDIVRILLTQCRDEMICWLYDREYNSFRDDYNDYEEIISDEDSIIEDDVDRRPINHNIMMCIDIQNKSGNTALMLAISQGQIEITEQITQLLMHIPVDSPGLNGHYDVGIDDDEFVSADLNLQNQQGNTALMLAASLGRTNIVQQLITNRADLNLQNQDGNTALTIAMSTFNKEIIMHLLLAGSNIDTKTLEAMNDDKYVFFAKDVIREYLFYISNVGDRAHHNENIAICKGMMVKYIVQLFLTQSDMMSDQHLIHSAIDNALNELAELYDLSDHHIKESIRQNLIALSVTHSQILLKFFTGHNDTFNPTLEELHADKSRNFDEITRILQHRERDLSEAREESQSTSRRFADSVSERKGDGPGRRF